MTGTLAALARRIALTSALLLAASSPSWGQQATQKQICVSTFGMNWTTSEEAQTHLLSRLKQRAVAELFGEAIWSVSEVKDLVVTRDEIHTFSAGLVRVRGNPRVFNGTGPGELCMSAELYVSEEDLRRLQPREVRKRVCVADPRLSSGDIRTLAEQQAQVQAVRDFEPSLRQRTDEEVAKLLHEARIEDAGFVPETVTYCATAYGVVYPIELLAVARTPLRSTEGIPSRAGDHGGRTLPASGSPQQTSELGRIKFDLLGCRRSGQQVKCEFLVTALEYDETIRLYAGSCGKPSSRAFDTSGTEMPAITAYIGNQRNGCEVRHQLVTGVPLKAGWIIQGVPFDTSTFAALDFGCYARSFLQGQTGVVKPYRLQLRSVPITE